MRPACPRRGNLAGVLIPLTQDEVAQLWDASTVNPRTTAADFLVGESAHLGAPQRVRSWTLSATASVRSVA